jgi:hypothetical protein
MDTKDGIPVDREDSSLTPEQVALLNKLEEIFRELSPARQLAMIRQLRGKSAFPVLPKPPV